MPASKFRKKPVEISAIVWDGTVSSATEVIDWILGADGTARFHDKVRADGATMTPYTPAYIAIDTLEGTMQAREGDWIIRGVQGEHYPCKPDIFWATYDIVDDRG